jgi:hypothetical protein
MTLTPFSAIQPATTTGVVVSTSPNERLVKLECCNVGAAAAFIKLYNKATTPLPGDTPILRYAIPPNGMLVISPGIVGGFTQGISYRITAGIADANDVAVVVDTVIINIYR